MKLYECPRNTYIKVLEPLPCPPDSIPIESGDVYLFYNLDGMFSRCKDKFGSIVYINASTEVEIVDEIT
jgi:hypothetical protein